MRGRIGTFEQVGAALVRHHEGRELVIRSITVNMNEGQAQRFAATHKRFNDKMSAEAFALLAVQAGLPKLMEQAMFDDSNRAARRRDEEQRDVPGPEPYQP